MVDCHKLILMQININRIFIHVEKKMFFANIFDNCKHNNTINIYMAQKSHLLVNWEMATARC